MSVFSLIRRSKVRAAIDEYMTKPPTPDGVKMKVPPSDGGSAYLVGMAFDYATRLGLEERGAPPTELKQLAGGRIGSWYGERYPRIGHRFEQVQRLLDRDVTTQSGRLSRYVARACYYLSELEVVGRASRTEQLNREPTAEELTELQELFDIIPWGEFEADDHQLLNPTFGLGSRIVNGADADLLVDNRIIDIKTVKRLQVRSRAMRQLVVYAILANHYCAETPTAEWNGEVESLGIYFARAGCLAEFPLRDVISKEGERSLGEELELYRDEGEVSPTS